MFGLKVLNWTCNDQSNPVVILFGPCVRRVHQHTLGLPLPSTVSRKSVNLQCAPVKVLFIVTQQQKFPPKFDFKSTCKSLDKLIELCFILFPRKFYNRLSPVVSELPGCKYQRPGVTFSSPLSVSSSTWLLIHVYCQNGPSINTRITHFCTINSCSVVFRIRGRLWRNFVIKECNIDCCSKLHYYSGQANNNCQHAAATHTHTRCNFAFIS